MNISHLRRPRTFTDAYDRGANSFTPLRLVLALMVLYSHSFPISGVAHIGSPCKLALIAAPITLALAFASWHLIDHPALKLKTRRPRIAPPPLLVPETPVQQT